MLINNSTIKNILALRNDRFGEFLLNIPAFRALKETFINANLIVVIDPAVRELAQSIPFIDEIVEWTREKHSLLAKLQFIKLLKKKCIDLAVMLNASQELNIITYFAGIPIRVGYDRKWGFLLTHKIKDEKYLGAKHEIEYNLELVSLVGAKTQDQRLSISLEDNIVNNLWKDVGIGDDTNLITLHPWTSDPIKQWPLEYFYRLAQRLIRELNLNVLVIGTRDELDKDMYFSRNFGDNLINMAGKTTLKQLAGLLKKSRLLISGDSGPVHLAGTVNTPVIAIFRNDIPAKSARRWGPRGAGDVIIERNNLNDISIDEVFEKAKEILRKEKT